jgi:glycosyltransferase involved in cell wall biosynthesis
MPLTKDAWNEGKCSFKAIQYLSLGIPAVISPIGMNTEVVMHGQNGYLAETDEDWLKFLTLLLENKALRNQYGANGRNHIVSNYSKEATTQKFIALFNEV